MPKTYPKRPCLYCDRPHTLRGDYCGVRCRVAAWRGRNREEVDDDDQDDDQDEAGDIDYQVTPTGRVWVVGTDDKYLVCAHPGCMVRLPAGSHAKYCCNACRQDAYRQRQKIGTK